MTIQKFVVFSERRGKFKIIFFIILIFVFFAARKTIVFYGMKAPMKQFVPNDVLFKNGICKLNGL